jgi:hypothetical protein
MSYDPASKSMILLTLPSSHPNLQLTPDGVSSGGVTPFGTWQWDGSDWHELSTPTAPHFAIGALFHVNPRLVPLAGDRGLLLYSSTTYTGTCQPAPVGCARLFGTARDRVETWTWNGARWAPHQPVHSPIDARLVANVDGTPTAFTPIQRWTWTGTDWQASRPAAGPFGGFAVADARDHDLVAYDGNRTYTWDGAWRRREGTPPKDEASPATTATTTTTPVTSAYTTTVAPIRTCTSSQLHLAFDKDLGSLMQQPGAYFELTNVSSTMCTLDGYPRVQLRDAAGVPVSSHQLDGSSYQIVDPGPQRVTVVPNATVYFGIGWADVNQATGGNEQGCLSIGSLSVVVAGATRALDAPARLGELYCPPGTSVSAIAPKGAFSPSSP